MESRRSGRLNSSKNHLKRDSNGRFKKVCGSITHLALDDNSVLVDLKTKKKISLRHYNLLISKNVITHNTKFICEKCKGKIKHQCKGLNVIQNKYFQIIK